MPQRIRDLNEKLSTKDLFVQEIDIKTWGIFGKLMINQGEPRGGKKQYTIQCLPLPCPETKQVLNAILDLDHPDACNLTGDP